MRGKGKTAWISILLLFQVLFLTVATVSPQVHDWVHGATPVTDCHAGQNASTGEENAPAEVEHSCAVTLFASGATLSLANFPTTGTILQLEEALVQRRVCLQTPVRPLLASGGPRAPPLQV